MDDKKAPTTSELPDDNDVGELMKQVQALEPQQPKKIPKPKSKPSPSKSSIRSNISPSGARKSFDIIRPQEIKKIENLEISAVSLPMASPEQKVDEAEPDKKSDVKDSAKPPTADADPESSHITIKAQDDTGDFTEPLPGFIEDDEADSKVIDETQGNKESSDQDPELIQASEASSTSFETQIQPAAEADDDSYHNFFDTEEYYPPLLPAHASVKKGHPILWTLFTLFILAALVGAFLLLRYLKII